MKQKRKFPLNCTYVHGVIEHGFVSPCGKHVGVTLLHSFFLCFEFFALMCSCNVVIIRLRPEMEDTSDVVSESKGDAASLKRIPEGFCVECEDQPASVLCLVCEVCSAVPISMSLLSISWSFVYDGCVAGRFL
jgi:hypothetical protein